MSSAIATVDSVPSASAIPVVANAASASSSQATGTDGLPSALIQNPRLILDPTAGFITEYLSANGSQVVFQTPSAITVAYLRIGLTSDGLTKQAAQPEHVATTA